MLSTSCLWFAKAATFSDDPWEGSGRAKTLPLEVDGLRKVVRRETPDGARTNHSVPQMLALWSQAAAAYVGDAAEHLYLNSWFAGTTESIALWEIYGSQGRGVALQSTTERYRKSAQFELPPEQYLFGRVTYHDGVETAPELLRDFTETISLPGSGLWPKVLHLALHKRSFYTHENEWRAVYQDRRPDIWQRSPCRIRGFDLVDVARRGGSKVRESPSHFKTCSAALVETSHSGAPAGISDHR